MRVNSVTKSSKNPTSKQLAVLKILYRFRFGTTDLLARALDLKDGRYIHMRLDALIKQEYIGKNYDSTYKIEGRPATYYLLSKAIGKELSLNTLRNAYKDKEASNEFIARQTSCIHDL